MDERRRKKRKQPMGKREKMLHNGLSANAKGWLLAKHHFATSSIFHQRVKVSALASLSPPSLPGRAGAAAAADHEGKQTNAFRGWTLGWICLFTCMLCRVWCTHSHTQTRNPTVIPFSERFLSVIQPLDDVLWFTPDRPLLCCWVLSLNCTPSCCKQNRSLAAPLAL